MDEKQIMALFVNLLFWPLVLYWVWKRRKESASPKRFIEEYNKPENKFKREVTKLGLTLSPFERRRQYPYIITPHYSSRMSPQKPTVIDSSRPLKDYEVKYLTKAVTTGRSERALFSHLVKLYGPDLVQLGNCSLFGFYPDIAYLDLKNNIFIDIEIDEIYSLKTKEPLHYVHMSAAEGDKRFEDVNLERDAVFRKNGWTVMRFSEDQIIKTPDQCIHLIEKLISYWQLKEPTLQFDETKLSSQKRWTVEECRQFALMGVREDNY